MRKFVAAATVASALGLVMSVGGSAEALPTPQPQPQASLLYALLGVDLSGLANMASGVLCNNHLVDYNFNSPVIDAPHPCVNGSIASDDRLNSGNFFNQGNPNHTGNIADVNGPADSGNSQSSGNFLNNGNPTSSGNLANTNGSTNSSDTIPANIADKLPTTTSDKLPVK